MYSLLFSTLLGIIFFIFVAQGEVDVWENVVCDQQFIPPNCDFRRIPLPTVEDYERCAPAALPLYSRNYFLGWGGRGETYRENRKAFGRIKLRPKMLRDISRNTLEITTLSQKVKFPIGIAPTALHILANPQQAENATAAAAAAMGAVMIMSSFSTTPIEEVAKTIKGSGGHAWLQIYVFKNQSYTLDIVRRAERAGFEALVLTVDSYIYPPILCDGKKSPQIANIRMANFPETFDTLAPKTMTFDDLRWLRTMTRLPIVAKGIVTGGDATMAITSGASAILVSNHGGRQLDNIIASIDALPEVVDAVNKMVPRRDVYLDGGIRNGFDVYKAIARGAKMVFVGRPSLWGLTLGGTEGVKKVLNILRTEFNNTMLLTGAANPGLISRDNIVPPVPIVGLNKKKK